MKQRKALLILSFIFMADLLMAQSDGQSGSSWFVYLLLAIVVFLFFLIVIQVSDNMLAIEAKRIGADGEGRSYSMVPNIKELIPRKRPEYIPANQSIKYLSKGHDILLEGAAEKVIDERPQVQTFGILPPDFIGLSPIPKMLVEEGQNVKAGDLLFFDKKRPEIKYAAPVSGEVIAINRGEKRSIAEVVILADKKMSYRDLKPPSLEGADRASLVNFLLESGAWAWLRQRPYDIVPDPEDQPRDIFISTFDTAPLAPDLNLVVQGRGEAFQKGLDVLNKLTEGSVHLGLNAAADQAPSSVFTEASGVKKYWFSGQHPAGNVGVQIHHIRPIGSGDKVWYLGVQEVIALGELFQSGRYDASRVIALTGAELKAPKYVRTYQGARLSELLKGNIKEGGVRIVSGDVLSGKSRAIDSFLDFYDDQVTVLEEGDDVELFGWLLPIKPRPTVSRTFPNFLFPGMEFKANTNTHGEKRAFVVTGQYESVLPMDIYVQHLMKAILIGDIERMEGLGIRELSEEDIALCEFTCTSKQPLQQILREGLEKMRIEG